MGGRAASTADGKWGDKHRLDISVGERALRAHKRVATAMIPASKGHRLVREVIPLVLPAEEGEELFLEAV